jgi:hypothetical protein
MPSTKPIEQVRKGRISIAMFQNEEGSKSRPISFQKGYRGKDGKWINQKISLYPNEVGPVLEAIKEFHDKTAQKQSA